MIDKIIWKNFLFKDDFGNEFYSARVSYKKSSKCNREYKLTTIISKTKNDIFNNSTIAYFNNRTFPWDKLPCKIFIKKWKYVAIENGFHSLNWKPQCQLGYQKCPNKLLGIKIKFIQTR